MSIIIPASVSLCIAVLAFGQCAQAAVQFPREIADCIDSQDCSLPQPVVERSGYAAYQYLDTAHRQVRWLFQYRLGAASMQTSATGTERLAGSVWVGAAATYHLDDERHYFPLYLDQVAPTPGNVWIGDVDGLDVVLSMPSSDLLAGGSFVRRVLSQEGYHEAGALGTHGSEEFGLNGEGLLPCLADGCAVGAEFNLLHMQFAVSGSEAALAPVDAESRSLLYAQSRSYTDDLSWNLGQAYHLVPLPDAGGLWLGALIGLMASGRRRCAGQSGCS